MIQQNIKYKFNQIETALIAAVSNLQLKIQNIISDVPVYIQNTGDFSYYVDKKFIDTKNEEIYLKIPRFVIKIDDIQPNNQEDTNPYNKVNYTFDDGNGPRNYQVVARRKSFNVTLTTNFVSSNYITALNHFEVMATLMSRDNVFTYEFLGNTFQAAYTFQSNSMEQPSIDMGQNSSRNVVVINQIELQLQLLIPRIETIKLFDDVGFDEVKIDLVEHNNTERIIETTSNDVKPTNSIPNISPTSDHSFDTEVNSPENNNEAPNATFSNDSFTKNNFE